MIIIEGDQKALFSIVTTPMCREERYSFSRFAPNLSLMRTLYCWVLSKEVSSIIFKVFGMTQPGIEPRSPGQLANTLPTRPMNNNNKCSKLTQKDYKARCDWVGKVTLWELCKQLKFAHTTKWYMYKPESIQENETQNSLLYRCHFYLCHYYINYIYLYVCVCVCVCECVCVCACVWVVGQQSFF